MLVQDAREAVADRADDRLARVEAFVDAVFGVSTSSTLLIGMVMVIQSPALVREREEAGSMSW